MKIVQIIVAVAMLALSGCATVVNGRTEPLGLSSNPAGAEVSIDNGTMKVITPTSIELKRDENHTFVFHKDGYQDTSATVTSGTSGWVWGNLLAGGIIGGVVDFATGAAYKFSDDTLSVNMTPVQVAAAPQPATQSAPQPAPIQPAPIPALAPAAAPQPTKQVSTKPVGQQPSLQPIPAASDNWEKQ
jgi:PEGA domain-containing protein